MSSNAPAKKRTERIDFRVSAEVKTKIKTASKFVGEGISDFILNRIMPEVERLIAAETQIRLNNESWQGFVEMLSSPKPASNSLKSAMQKYRKAQDV